MVVQSEIPKAKDMNIIKTLYKENVQRKVSLISYHNTRRRGDLS